MWRFTGNNGITESFYNKMELINKMGAHQSLGLQLQKPLQPQTQSEGVMFLGGLGFRGVPPFVA